MPGLHESVDYCGCCNTVAAKDVMRECDSIHHADSEICPDCVLQVDTPDGTKSLCRNCKELENL